MVNSYATKLMTESSTPVTNVKVEKMSHLFVNGFIICTLFEKTKKESGIAMNFFKIEKGIIIYWFYYKQISIRLDHLT